MSVKVDSKQSFVRQQLEKVRDIFVLFKKKSTSYRRTFSSWSEWRDLQEACFRNSESTNLFAYRASVAGRVVCAAYRHTVAQVRPTQKKHKHNLCFLVGVARLELAASWSRTMRATKLRYTPMIILSFDFSADWLRLDVAKRQHHQPNCVTPINS